MRTVGSKRPASVRHKLPNSAGAGAKPKVLFIVPAHQLTIQFEYSGQETIRRSVFSHYSTGVQPFSDGSFHSLRCSFQSLDAL